jgi:hypothetical protein
LFGGRRDVFAAHHGPQYGAFDVADAVTASDAGKVPVGGLDRYEERLVASALYAQRRVRERRGVERSTDRTEQVERGAHVWW